MVYTRSGKYTGGGMRTAASMAWNAGHLAASAYRKYKSGKKTVRTIRKAIQMGRKAVRRRRTSRAVAGGFTHNDQSSQKFKIILRKQPLKNASIHAPIIWTETRQQILSGGEGKQAVDILAHYANAEAFLTVNTLANDLQGNPVGYFNLLSSQAASGAAAGPFSVGTNYNPKLYLNVHSVYSDMNFTNMLSTSCTVHVYFFKAKRNSQNTPLDAWIRDLDQLDYGFTDDARALTTDTTWGVSRNLVSSFGQKPLTSSVRKNYSVVAYKRFELNGGSSHRLVFNTIYNRRVEKSILQTDDTTANGIVGNLTMIPLVIIQGSPTGIGDNAGGIQAAEITTGITKVGVTYARTWKFTSLKESIHLPVRMGCYGMVQGTTHVYGPSIIDDEDTVASVKRV